MLNRHILTTSSAFSAGALALVLAAPAAGQTASHDAVVDLPDYVVSATRTPQDAQFTTSSVDVLPMLRLELAQIGDLNTALATIPGVNIVNTGATGGQSSVFIRGSASTQTLFVVDGVPMNNRSAGYNNFLGSADLVGLDRVEVLRGPQSTLYGSSAMGGVIFIDSARGCGATTGNVATTFGSFATLGASASVKGGTEKLGYSASLERFHTDNDLPHNAFNSWSYSTRVEGTPVSGLLIGTTFRGQQGDYQETGSRWGYGRSDVAADNHLSTLYAQWSLDKEFSTRLTAAQHQRRYTLVGPYGATEIRDRRDIVDWQNTLFDLGGIELVGGASAEHARHDSSAGKVAADNYAGYLSTTIHPSKTSTLNAGLRYDDFETFGSAWTWRAGAAWLPVAGTKLHASIGTGFCAPTNEDTDGNPAWGMDPNHNLKAEKSTGWDLGVDQKLFGDVVTAGVTYFRTRYRDRILYVSDPVTWVGRMENIERSVADGVETAVTVDFTKSIRSRVAYTYLEAVNSVTHARLQRQPRHTIDSDVTVQPAAGWTVGAGLRIVADRIDKTPERPTFHRIEDYTTVRLFTSYEVTKNLLLKARIENALSEKYDEAGGYAALPFRTFGGLEYKF